MITTKKTSRFIVINTRHRDAGESEINGKLVTWEGGYAVTLIQFEDSKGQARNYIVEPEYVPEIEAILATIHWGALVNVELRDRHIIDLTVLHDWAAEDDL